MPRPPIYDKAMTTSERKKRSNEKRTGEILSAIQFARLIACELRWDMTAQPGCLAAFRAQLDQLDAALDAADQAASQRAARGPKPKIKRAKRA